MRLGWTSVWAAVVSISNHSTFIKCNSAFQSQTQWLKFRYKERVNSVWIRKTN